MLTCLWHLRYLCVADMLMQNKAIGLAAIAVVAVVLLIAKGFPSGIALSAVQSRNSLLKHAILAAYTYAVFQGRSCFGYVYDLLTGAFTRFGSMQLVGLYQRRLLETQLVSKESIQPTLNSIPVTTFLCWAGALFKLLQMKQKLLYRKPCMQVSG